MRKKITSFLLAIVMLIGGCFLGACNNDPDPTPANTISQRVQTFVNTVASIKTPITLDAGVMIDAAYIVYDFLGETEKDSDTVKTSKERLDGYKTSYDVLKAAADAEAEVAREEARINEFLQAVASLPVESRLTSSNREEIDNAYALYNELKEDSKATSRVIEAYTKLLQADEIVAELENEERLEILRSAAETFIARVEDIGEVTLASFDVIEALLYDYNEFPQELKDFEGVPEAKQKLDEAYAAYLLLKDEADVEEFLELVGALGEVTLESERAIARAESVYADMSEAARGNVVAAYEILKAARAKYDELFAIAEGERIARFLAAVEKIPTDIENIDITWYDVLYEAQTAYFALSYASYVLPEVEEAFAIWNAVQSAFDALGYEKIPTIDLSIVYSDDVVPNLVLQLFPDKLETVKTFYGVSSNAELTERCAVYLDVYVDGVYADKAELNLNVLVNGFILLNTEVFNILTALSEKNTAITSGANFSFSVHFEDRNSEMIPSDKTRMSNSTNKYTW